MYNIPIYTLYVNLNLRKFKKATYTVYVTDCKVDNIQAMMTFPIAIVILSIMTGNVKQ